MIICEACGQEEAVHHVTVSVDVFSPKSEKRKVVQFWLCDKCELNSKQVLADDRSRRQRIAKRLTEDPEYASPWREWRRRRGSPSLAATLQDVNAVAEKLT